MNVGEQMSLADLDIWFGKMCQELSVPTTAMTFEQSSNRPQELPIVVPQFLDCRQARVGLMQGAFWEMDGLSLGEYTMHSFGEYPKDERESHLLQILEERPHPKYCLSPKACQGILNRAEKRGKELPAVLKDALLESVFKSEPVVTGGAKGCSSNMIEQGPCRQDKTNTSSTVAIEGNGSRPSHHGDGFIESDKSYTLNSTEQHSIAFSQDAYDKYTESGDSATLKNHGGTYGGGSESLIVQ